MKNYKLITWYNAIGVKEQNFFNSYKIARKWYEINKKDDYVCSSIIVDEKGKVIHIFDHSKNFYYDKATDFFPPKGK